MSTTSNNPLSKHFRQPAIYLKLPSGGKFWPEGAVDLPLNGEIPIFPMTVKDEIMLRTPDALLNGNSITEMILSCCPNIKDAWNIPAVDLDAILIAIRLASYGPGMDIVSTCPRCKEDNEPTVDLRTVLDNIQPVNNYNKSTVIDNLVFDFKPQLYKDLNQSNIITFEQQKLINTITSSDISEEEKAAYFADSFKKLTDLNIDTVASCIRSITSETGEVVTNPALIHEFLSNCDRQDYEDIKNTINGLAETNSLKPITLTCDHCKADYVTRLEFNQSNFFA
jgi:hypothetical protein